MSKYDVWDESLLGVSLHDGAWHRKGGLYVYGPARTKRGVYPMPDGVGLHDKAGLAQWVAKTLRQIEREHGITSWVPDSTYTMLFHLPPDHRRAKTARPVWSLCGEMISAGGRGASLHICGRPVDEADGLLCKMHRAGKNRSEANLAKWRAEWAAAEDASQRAGLQTVELRELWDMVCDQRDVMHRGDPVRVTTGGMAQVDSEVLMMLLRELIER